MMLKSKVSMQSQSQLPNVSTRLGLVWLESRLRANFVSANESLGSVPITKSLGSALINSASFTAIPVMILQYVRNGVIIYHL